MAEPAPIAPPTAEALPRESPLGVLGLTFGLALLVSAFLLPLRSGAVELDAAQLLAQRFELSPLPFELEAREARRLPAGEELVLLVPAGAELDFSAVAAGTAGGRGAGKRVGPAPGQSGGRPSEHVDWSALPAGDAGHAPACVAIVWLPRRLAAQALSDAFRPPGPEGPPRGDRGGPRRFRESFGGGSGGVSIGPEGGRVARGSGELDWRGWGTNWLHVRRYYRDVPLQDAKGKDAKGDGAEGLGVPRFRDTIRLNLSLSGRACILHAIWEPGFPADVERLRELLAALGPKV